MRILSLTLVLFSLFGCAETEVRGRDVLRVAPLRIEGALQPRPNTEGALVLEAGRDVADDDELAQLTREIPLAFTDEIAKTRGRVTDATARLDHCRLRAGPGRQYTIYRAKCRASLVRHGVTLIVVEAEAVRRVRSQAVTRDEAKEIRKMVRNPLLDVDDSQAALADAARAAARRLTDPRMAAQSELSLESAPLDDEEGRKLAAARLARAKRPEEFAAALVDLARYGRADDGALVLPLLTHEHALVRRAAALAAGELGAPQAMAALQALLDDTDEDVRDEAAHAIEILCALDDGGLFQRSARSSKSSGAGAGEAGLIDDAAKNDSTWRQNEACSKR
jgi:hypothetical protein